MVVSPIEVQNEGVALVDISALGTRLYFTMDAPPK
jgi:hypothetical protein